MSEEFAGGDWIVRKCSGFDYGSTTFSISGVCTNIKKEQDAYVMAAAPAMYAEIEEEIDFLTETLNKAEPGSNVATAISFRIYALESLLAKARGESCEN